MGRYDFRPHRVHQAATQLLASKRITTPPPWYNVIGNVPPPQILIRNQPVEHEHQQHFKRSKRKKASRIFSPQEITYEEDSLRREFFKDHPWELARPRIILENDGKDGQRRDWSHIRQPGQPLNGESVVQRQMWLLHNEPDMTTAKAYDQARHEFYHERLQEDVERRVVREEALATGAYFGKSWLQIGMELEDKEFERWKEWATRQIAQKQQLDAAVYTGTENDAMAPPNEDSETLAAMEDLDDSVPSQDQSADDSGIA